MVLVSARCEAMQDDGKRLMSKSSVCASYQANVSHISFLVFRTSHSVGAGTPSRDVIDFVWILADLCLDASRGVRIHASRRQPRMDELAGSGVYYPVHP